MVPHTVLLEIYDLNIKIKDVYWIRVQILFEKVFYMYNFPYFYIS